MSLLDRFGDGSQLKIEHDTQYGFVSVSHPGHISAAPELTVNPCTINITTEDFLTMLKWYTWQKDKDENKKAIQWTACDECPDRDRCKSDIRNRGGCY